VEHGWISALRWRTISRPSPPYRLPPPPPLPAFLWLEEVSGGASSKGLARRRGSLASSTAALVRVLRCRLGRAARSLPRRKVGQGQAA